MTDDKTTMASRKAGAEISDALANLLIQARRTGCRNPKLFFEAESKAVFVLDGDHPAYKDHERFAERMQAAIVLRAPIATPFDTGAW